MKAAVPLGDCHHFQSQAENIGENFNLEMVAVPEPADA